MFARLGYVTARYASFIAAIWLATAIAASLFLAPRFTTALTGPPLLVNGSDSAIAQQTITERFGEPFAEQDLIVFTSASLTVDDPAFQHSRV